MKPKCSICGGSDQVTGCGDGHLCQPCADLNRAGRDLTTQKAKLAQTALRGKAGIARASVNGASLSDLDTYAIESAALLALEEPLERPLLGFGGEVVPQDNPELLDTMATPGVAALDASRDRLSLVSQVGVDCAALALDSADSIKAANSFEKMLSHELAALHTVAMNYMAKANLQQDPKLAISTMNLSIRAMEVYQRGVLTVKRLRSSGSQSIVIKHIDARDGGMVAISSAPNSKGEKNSNG